MHEKVARHLSKTLQRYMKERELSISSLHKRTGISRETLYRIIRQEALPTADVLIRLAVELEVNPGILIDDQSRSSKLGSADIIDLKEVMELLASIDTRLQTIEAHILKPN